MTTNEKKKTHFFNFVIVSSFYLCIKLTSNSFVKLQFFFFRKEFKIETDCFEWTCFFRINRFWKRFCSLTRRRHRRFINENDKCFRSLIARWFNHRCIFHFFIFIFIFHFIFFVVRNRRFFDVLKSFHQCLKKINCCSNHEKKRWFIVICVSSWVMNSFFLSNFFFNSVMRWFCFETIFSSVFTFFWKFSKRLRVWLICWRAFFILNCVRVALLTMNFIFTRHVFIFAITFFRRFLICNDIKRRARWAFSNSRRIRLILYFKRSKNWYNQLSIRKRKKKCKKNSKKFDLSQSIDWDRDDVACNNCKSSFHDYIHARRNKSCMISSQFLKKINKKFRQRIVATKNLSIFKELFIFKKFKKFIICY